MNFAFPLQAETSEQRSATPPINPSVIKPKWEIRLPQLLNSTVGPDRQVKFNVKEMKNKERKRRKKFNID